VDEVLSVGDESFQRKCINRVKEFQREGRTIVLVTHTVEKVRDICDQAVMLERGRVKTAGEVNPVLREFRLAMLASHAGFDRVDVTRDVEITEVALLDGSGHPLRQIEPGGTLVVQVEVRVNRSVPEPVVTLTIHDATDQQLHEADTDRGAAPLNVSEGAKQRVTFELGAIPFVEGRHFVSVGVRTRDRSQVYDWHDQQYAFEIREGDISGRVHIPTTVRVEPL